MKHNIIKGVAIILGIVSICELLVIKMAKKKYDEQGQIIHKVATNYDTAYQWLKLKERKGVISEYCIQNGFQKVAIYGFGDLGKLLYHELKDNGIEVEYAIDMKAEEMNSNLDILNPLEVNELPAVDCIIVTAVFAFGTIVKNLNEKANCPILSLMEIVVEI